jgi:hypothetical protein
VGPKKSAQPSDRFGPDSSAEEVGLDGGQFRFEPDNRRVPKTPVHSRKITWWAWWMEPLTGLLRVL